MKNRALCALLIGLCVVSLAPAAETAESQLKAFQKAATAALAKNPATPGDRRGETATYTLANLAQLATATSSGNANQQELERAITSIMVLAQNDPDVTKAGESLIATMKAERQARADRARTEIEALLKKAGEACLAAKIPADLDDSLAALAPYARNSGYDRRASDDQESWQRASAAYRFVTRWQDYLAARAQPNIGEATNILRELSNSVGYRRDAPLAGCCPAFSSHQWKRRINPGRRQPARRSCQATRKSPDTGRVHRRRARPPRRQSNPKPIRAITASTGPRQPH